MRRIFAGPVAAAVLATGIAVGSGTAAAQSMSSTPTFNFYTTGMFGSPCPANTGSTVSCTSPSGFGLTFTGAPLTPGGIFSGSFVNYGLFTPVGTGTGTATQPVPFTLFIHQTIPTIANDSVTGSLTGTLTRMTCSTANGGICGSSSVVWTPSTTSLTLGPVNYKIFTTAGIGGVPIGYNDNTSINGQAFATTTTPEPSSMALLGTGLVGLVPMIRRRKAKK